MWGDLAWGRQMRPHEATLRRVAGCDASREATDRDHVQHDRKLEEIRLGGRKLLSIRFGWKKLLKNNPWMDS